MPKFRYDFLDVFKFWALLSLMFYHSFELWATGGTNIITRDSSFSFYEIIYRIGLVVCYPSCLGMPFLSGISLFLMSKKFLKNNSIEVSRSSFLFIFKRFLFVFTAATLLNVLSFGFSNLYETDILHCIAFSSVIVFLVSMIFPRWAWPLLALVWVLASPYLQSWAWSTPFPSWAIYFKVIIFGNPESDAAFYPLTPWLAMDLLGFFSGSFLVSHYEKIVKWSWVGYFSFFPSFLISSQPWTFYPDSFWAPEVFLPSPWAFFSILATSASFILILMHWWHNKRINNFIFKLFVAKITWIYVIHTALLFHLIPWLYRISEGNLGVFFLSQIFQVALVYALTLFFGPRMKKEQKVP